MDTTRSGVDPQETVALRFGRNLPGLKSAHRRFNLVYLFLMYFLTVVFVFASTDVYMSTDLTLKLNAMFLNGAPLFRSYLSYFEILVLLVCIIMLERNGFRYRHSSLALRCIFVAAVVCLSLDLFNPNDEAPKYLGLPILAYLSSITYLLFMFTMFFLREEAFLLTIKRIGSAFLVLILIRSVILFGLWAAGMGNYSFGANSVLTEGDSLLIFGFGSVLLLALFLLDRRPSLFLGWILTFVLQVLSFRRSGLYVLLGASAMTVMMFLFNRANILSIVRNAILVFAFLALIGGLSVRFIHEETITYYTNRYFGVFSGMGRTESTKYAGDSGHFDESAMTLAYAFDKGDFWGYGMGDPDRINIPGATIRLYVHNVYAASWLYHGVYEFLFYVFLGLILVPHAAKLFAQRKRWSSSFVILSSSILGFMVMLMIIWYTNPIHQAESLRMRVFWVTLLAVSFRITPSNVEVLLSDDKTALQD